ncbi:hypothetical protein HDU92_001803, partial [Lobulomyces angularis]
LSLEEKKWQSVISEMNSKHANLLDECSNIQNLIKKNEEKETNDKNFNALKKIEEDKNITDSFNNKNNNLEIVESFVDKNLIFSNNKNFNYELNLEKDLFLDEDLFEENQESWENEILIDIKSNLSKFQEYLKLNKKREELKTKKFTEKIGKQIYEAVLLRENNLDPKSINRNKPNNTKSLINNNCNFDHIELLRMLSLATK